MCVLRQPKVYSKEFFVTPYKGFQSHVVSLNGETSFDQKEFVRKITFAPYLTEKTFLKFSEFVRNEIYQKMKNCWPKSFLL